LFSGCDWEYIVKRMDCPQEASLIICLNNEINKLIEENSFNTDMGFVGIVTTFSLIDTHKIQEVQQGGIFIHEIEKSKIENCFNIKIQKCFIGLENKGFYGPPLEYSLIVEYDGFGWKAVSIEKIL